MKMTRVVPTLRMVNHLAISLHEYDDGSWNVHLVKLDRASGRMTFDTLIEGVHRTEYPSTPAELLRYGLEAYVDRALPVLPADPRDTPADQRVIQLELPFE